MNPARMLTELNIPSATVFCCHRRRDVSLSRVRPWAHLIRSIPSQQRLDVISVSCRKGAQSSSVRDRFRHTAPSPGYLHFFGKHSDRLLRELWGLKGQPRGLYNSTLPKTLYWAGKLTDIIGFCTCSVPSSILRLAR